MLTAPADLAPFLTDHRALYHGAAAAVVLPAETAEVARLLAWCNAQRVPVVPQGGNTSYCGGATPDVSGRAVVLAMRRMNRIRTVDAANFALVAEAGCTLQAVQSAAQQVQCLFPLSLGSEGSCQSAATLPPMPAAPRVALWHHARPGARHRSRVCGWQCAVRACAAAQGHTGYDLRHLLTAAKVRSE